MVNERIEQFNDALNDEVYAQNPLLLAGADLYRRRLEENANGDMQVFAQSFAGALLDCFANLALNEAELDGQIVKSTVVRLMHVWHWGDLKEHDAVSQEIEKRLSERPIPMKPDAMVEIRTQNEILFGMFENFKDSVQKIYG